MSLKCAIEKNNKRELKKEFQTYISAFNIGVAKERAKLI